MNVDGRHAFSGWLRRLASLGSGVDVFLIAVGLTALAVFGGARLDAVLGQARARNAFERALSEAPAARSPAGIAAPEPDRSDWSPTRVRAYEQSKQAGAGAPIGRLDIDSIGLSVIVLDSTDDWALNRGVGRIAGTADFDQPGNVGIAGHRDGFFRSLKNIALHHRIRLATLNGTHEYEVKELRVVDPDDVWVLAPTERPMLTLVTCYPFYYLGSAPLRFIVRAERVTGRSAAGPARARR